MYPMQEDYSLQENGNCSDTYIVFCLSSDQIDLQAVSQILQIESGFTKIEGCSDNTKKVLMEKCTDFWAFSSQGQLVTTSSEKHLVLLLDQLESNLLQVVHLIDQMALSAVFHCFWVNDSFLGGPVLSANVMRRIANLHSSLKFEFF
jgi:Domain of unknown function (DUF4279)